VGDRFLHLACQGAIRPSDPRQLRHWLWYIVKLSLLNCNKIRAGSVAQFMGGLASCLINLCFGWFN